MKQQRESHSKGHSQTSYRQESLFHHAWMSLNFDRQDLTTTKQEAIRIHHPGKLNHDQGPDFLDAEIQIGPHLHHGHVELHLHADDWIQHGHHRDPHYNAVVLHVFLFHGKRQVLRVDGSEIPELYLGDRIRAARSVQLKSVLACHGVGHPFLPTDPHTWMAEAGALRLFEKSGRMELALAKLEHDWSQLLWEELAAALGGPVNAHPFKELASHVPWSLVRRYTYSSETLEALLFGSCRILEGQMIDPYQANLQDHWRYLQAKHALMPKAIPFKFHRMHPAGFPIVRIAQLAALACHYRPIFQLLELSQIRRFLEERQLPTSEYWAHRYEFGNTVNERKSELGAASKERIVVNVLAPLLHLYGRIHGGKAENRDLLAFLQEIPPENNKVTRKFIPLGLQPSNALQSQGLLGIEKGLCMEHRCLECPVGRGIMGLDARLTLAS